VAYMMDSIIAPGTLVIKNWGSDNTIFKIDAAPNQYGRVYAISLNDGAKHDLMKTSLIPWSENAARLRQEEAAADAALADRLQQEGRDAARQAAVQADAELAARLQQEERDAAGPAERYQQQLSDDDAFAEAIRRSLQGDAPTPPPPPSSLPRSTPATSQSSPQAVGASAPHAPLPIEQAPLDTASSYFAGFVMVPNSPYLSATDQETVRGLTMLEKRKLILCNPHWRRMYLAYHRVAVPLLDQIAAVPSANVKLGTLHRRLSMRAHPERHKSKNQQDNPGGDEAFRALNKIKEELSEYDDDHTEGRFWNTVCE
jgi:hypothetical protein